MKTLDWISSLTVLAGSALAEPLTGYDAHDDFVSDSHLVCIGSSDWFLVCKKCHHPLECTPYRYGPYQLFQLHHPKRIKCSECRPFPFHTDFQTNPLLAIAMVLNHQSIRGTRLPNQCPPFLQHCLFRSFCSLGHPKLRLHGRNRFTISYKYHSFCGRSQYCAHQCSTPNKLWCLR